MNLSTRLMAAMVALVLVTATAVGMLTYRNIEAIALPSALERMEMHTRILATELEAPIIAARADVNTQGRAVQSLVRTSLAGGRDPLDGTPEAQWRNALAARFAAELTAKRAYARFGLRARDRPRGSFGAWRQHPSPAWPRKFRAPPPR
jgi:hypothetical protein